jgi:hypothetical protein
MSGETASTGATPCPSWPDSVGSTCRRGRMCDRAVSLSCGGFGLRVRRVCQDCRGALERPEPVGAWS